MSEAYAPSAGERTPGPESGGDLAPLLDRNRRWSARKTCDDPGFFRRLLGQQKPDYFWIGCSDSRVPATEIVDLDPGEMFVHRNVANLASADDPNFAAALLFAVHVLCVRHIIVVGHYGCGGIHAAMSSDRADVIGAWLAPVMALHRRLLGSTESGLITPEHLCELNVIKQVVALAHNEVVRAAWARAADLTLHGWVYAIGDGLLKPICQPVSAGRPLPLEAAH